MNKSKAFTMAEILLSLTIIGVVAAITLPALTGNINERTWNTQRKALYARISQAIALMPALNGYADSETFVTAGLSKVLKINNICDNDHIEDCGIPTTKITHLGGSALATMPKTLSELNPKNVSMMYDDRNTFSDGHYTPAGENTPYLGSLYSYSAINTKAVAFETHNGESVLAFYNSTCVSDSQETLFYFGPKVCANFVYDLNGKKGPNTVGKDIGIITALYPSDSIVVAPMPFPRHSGISVTFSQAAKACTNLSKDYRAANLHELIALIYNENLMNTTQGEYWSNTRYNSERAWKVSRTTVSAKVRSINNPDFMYALCIQR